MSAIMRVLKSNILTDNQVWAASQMVYFVAAPLMMFSCVLATTRFAESPFQIFLGLVTGAILTFQLIGIGLILSAMKK